MYTIKSVYKSLLNEVGGMPGLSDEETKNMSDSFRNIRMDFPLKKIEEGIFVGRFDSKSLSLWNEKDGSGGRGEYTVASHFLGSDFEDFKRESLDKFFIGLATDYTFHNEIGFKEDDDHTVIARKFKDYISSLELELENINMTNTNKASLIMLRDKPESLISQQAFRLSTGEGSWKTVLRKINKMRFLRSISSSEESNFSNASFGLYDLLNSVTTSGSESKSTDVYIDKKRIKKEFSNILGITTDMSIEVKEISDITSTVDGGSGIRLASGSKLESMKNDIIFCLTILCIITDISNEDTLLEDSKNIDREAVEVLVSLKNNQVPASKVKALITYLSHPSMFRRILSGLRSLIERSGSSKTKKELGYNALKHLDSMFASEMTASDRSEMINTGLSTSIADSINAEYFCIVHGWNSSKYKKNPNQLGKDQFVLIHKSRYKDVLGFGSYQNGGTAYATIKNKEVAKFFRTLFSSSSIAEGIFHINNDNIYTKREIFIKKLLAEGGKAGHMMHPYENLHMKISDMKEMISDFQNDFEISEKVDGANLFFTINPDTGELLFSRNKADMTRDETLEKFGPSHPAHILFTEGANSIYNAAKASLSRDDAKAIFGQAPDGGKTYINFEIMHPKKPNQIKYDMKYVVFHTIVDFDINGVKVSSSPDDPRLLSLLEKMQSYFATEDNDFSLGSNLKVKLNALSDADIDELMTELNKITSSLNLSDDMTIADAIKKEIEMLLDKNNLSELLSEDKIEMIYDFITNESSTVTGNIIKKDLDKDIKKSLVGLGLTSKTKAYKIVKQVTKEFRPLFILLGIKLLHNIPSRYMSSEASNKNVDELRRLLNAALEDYDNLINLEDPSDIESRLANTLSLHVANIRSHGIERSVSSPIEGGVFIGKDGNTYKVTGGFAPLNQILGTAMRSLDHMPIFEREFDLQERRG